MFIRSAALAIGTLALSTLAQADVITFGPGEIGDPVEPTVEGAFIYSTLSGGLFRDTEGNGDGFNMEGLSGAGGVLKVVRNDVPGGAFTFNGADVAFQFEVSFDIVFEGYLLGVLQASDAFAPNLTSTYTTFASSNLAGVAIDELRVNLVAPPSTASVVDNIIVTPSRIDAVPEPASLALFAGMVGLLAARRRA